MTTKEIYWKFSLIILIISLGVILFFEFLPFLSGVLGASTVYVLVRKQMHRLTEVRKMGNNMAALLILGEVILCFLIPAFLAVWMLINKMKSIDLDPNLLIEYIQNITSVVREKTGYYLLEKDNLTTLTTFITKVGQALISEGSSFLVNCVVLLFVLYFMLISSKRMEGYLYDILPFNDKNKKNVIKEIRIIVQSNAIGIPLLAIVQGVVAMIGYMIFGVSDPVLFGFLTCFATIIPLVGTSLVWFPLVVFFAMSGNWTDAIGLAVYALLIITNIDNLIRFLLQKKIADTHPLITVFGVIIGLSLFGFWGVIFGPLLLSMFILCFDIFKREYLDEKKE